MNQASSKVVRAVIALVAVRLLYVWAAGGNPRLQTLSIPGGSPEGIQDTAPANQPFIKTDPLLDAIALGDSGRTDESEKALLAILAKGDNAAAHNALGILYFKKGDVAKALRQFDDSVKHDPKFPDAYFNRASVRQAQGDNAGALADYAKVIELKPQAPGMQKFAEAESARLRRKP